MIITGLKVLIDKGWKPDSSFTSDSGQNMPVPANHKFVLTDELGDIVNATIVSPTPLALKVGAQPINLTLTSSVSKSQFGWTVKGTLTSK